MFTYANLALAYAAARRLRSERLPHASTSRPITTTPRRASNRTSSKSDPRAR